MDGDNRKSIPPEVKATARLLLETEKKIELLREQLANLDKAESPTLKLNPPALSIYKKQNTPVANEKAAIEAKITELKNTSLQIVEEIEKASSETVTKRVQQLKNDWIKDLEPGGAGESKDIYRMQKWANRELNKDWVDLDQVEETPTPFQENKDDIDGRKSSYLDKARGLRDKYSYLNKDESPAAPGKEKDKPGPSLETPTGPDIDIEMDEH